MPLMDDRCRLRPFALMAIRPPYSFVAWEVAGLLGLLHRIKRNLVGQDHTVVERLKVARDYLVSLQNK